jgi:ssDNA-binding Zn-finger/Zn-ribbon topoisomerase 1
MGKLVKIVVCPNCEGELKIFEATRFGNFLKCCNCKNRVFVPLDRAGDAPYNARIRKLEHRGKINLNS